MANFVISNEGLVDAAEKYNTICTNYSSAMESFIGQLNAMTAEWTDESSAAWTEAVGKVKTELEKIKSNLEHNRDLLNKVADSANAAQTKIKQQINNIYGG